MPTAEEVLLGEAGGEGPEGLKFVADVLYNRSITRKKTIDQVASESALNKKGVRVYQFTAAGRPDLQDFYAQQPEIYQRLASQLIAERKRPDYAPTYKGIEHYVTKDFWENRQNLGKGHWLHKMKPVKTIGNHVALVEK